MAKDVLNTLKAMAACYETERQSADGWRALETLSELIAADVRLQWIRANGCSHDEYDEAIRAHDSALAACRGLT